MDGEFQLYDIQNRTEPLAINWLGRNLQYQEIPPFDIFPMSKLDNEDFQSES